MHLILNYLKNYKPLIVLALVLAAINQVFSLLDPQIFRYIIDNYASKASELPSAVFIQGILLLLLASIGVALVSRVAKNFQDYYVNVITQRLGAKMYSDSVNHSFSLAYAVFEDQRSGELLQKLQKARSDAQLLVTQLINVVFLSLVGIVFVLTYAFFVNWLVGIVYILVIPLMGGITFYISRKIKAHQRQIVKETADLAGSTTETLRNIELVKSLGLEDQEIKRLNEVNEKILSLELKKVKLVRALSFVQGTLVNALRSAMLLLLLWLIYRASISLGQFFTLWFYSFVIFGPLGELGTLSAQYQETMASTDQLQTILSITPQEKPKDPVTLTSVETIEFNDVTFKYESKDIPSLRDINLTIKAGETVAFVGPSGSGKTTVMKLLAGLYEPSEGKVFFNGIDSKTVNFDTIRTKIGLVSQETQLFSGTIKENLLFVNPTATDEECLTALRQAAAEGLVLRGEKGLDTKIGEGGIKLSGGERQRLAIARALLRRPEIIIFDEATSSLDSMTEKEITETIKEIGKEFPNLIKILVAHRLSTIVHSDRIYVLEKGTIIEEGSHHELVEKKGLYYALWRQQIASDESAA